MMEKMNLEILKELFVRLEQYLKKYGDNTVANQYRIVQSTIYAINSDVEESEKCKEVIRNYKKLFSAKGGLSEFYIWDNDFEKRKEINTPFDDIRKSLWGIMKNYV